MHFANLNIARILDCLMSYLSQWSDLFGAKNTSRGWTTERSEKGIVTIALAPSPLHSGHIKLHRGGPREPHKLPARVQGKGNRHGSKEKETDEGGATSSLRGLAILGGQVPKLSLLAHDFFSHPSPTSQEDPPSPSLCHLSPAEQERAVTPS